MISLIRYIYLIIIAAAYPLAFLHYDYFHPESFAKMDSTSSSALIFGTFFLIMFHVLFTARYFPFDLKSAINMFASLVLAVFTSSLLQNASPFLGAFALVFTTSLTYMIYFITMCILFLNKKKREHYFYYSQKPYLILLLFFLIISLLLTIFLTREYVRALLTEEYLFLMVLAIVGMGFEVYQSVYRLLKQNMFQFDKGPEKQMRDEQLKQSGWVAVGAMAISILFIILIVNSYIS